MAFVGIDLGTTTSEIAIYQDGNPRILRDTKGKEIIDSYFGYEPKTRQPSVGHKVKSIFKSDPESCVEQIKRKMGQDVQVSVGDRELRPEEVSAHILTYLKLSAEADLNDEVNRAVITVPANFPDAARRATKAAGEIAGFKVDRIINEPTAAALAYGHAEGMEEEYVMVYDLGGGTFDVSVVEYVGNAIDVRASAGDPHLGGKDFDEALYGYVADQFENEHNISIEKDSGNYYRLLFACEEAKKELSFNHATTINIPFFTVKDGDPITLDVDVTRAKLEELIGQMVDRTEKAVDVALKDAELSRSDVSRVLLVGGSTRIPYVRNLVERVMGKKPLYSIDPDRTVAMGAAVQAAIIDGKSDQIIMDVCPLSLGTCVAVNVGGTLMPGHYSEIIEPNSPLLKPSTKTYNTVVEDQEVVDFKVYQRNAYSESDWAEVDGDPNKQDQYALLDKKKINIPTGPAGQKINVTYTYDQNGTLDIEVEVEATGTKIPFGVSTLMGGEDIEASRQKIDGAWEESKYLDDVQALLHAAEKEMANGLSDGKEQQLRTLIEDMKEALAANDRETIKQHEEEITDVLFELD